MAVCSSGLMPRAMQKAERARKQDGSGCGGRAQTSFHHRVGWVCIASCPGRKQNSCVEIHICPPPNSVWRNSLKESFYRASKTCFTCKILHSTLVT